MATMTTIDTDADAVPSSSLNPLQPIYQALFDGSPEFQIAASETCVKQLTLEDACGGRGYLSDVVKATVEFADADRKPFTFVMKVPNRATVDAILSSKGSAIEENMAESVSEQVMDGHNTECEFYETFSDCRTVPLPKVWKSKRAHPGGTDGVILMEYVAGVPQSRLVNFSNEQVKVCIRMLAQLHAYALRNPSKWQGKFRKSLFIGPYADMPKQMLPHLLQFDASLETLANQLDNAFGNAFAQYALVDAISELSLPRVLCHGDFWTNNILWHAVDGEPTSLLCSVIDWQFVFEDISILLHRNINVYPCASGNPMFDLARLLVSSMDPEARHCTEEWAIQFYLDSLRPLLGEMAESFTVEKLTKAYKLAMINQAIHAITMPIYVSHAASNSDGSSADDVQRRLVNRTKAALSEAVEALQEVAPPFVHTQM